MVTMALGMQWQKLCRKLFFYDFTVCFHCCNSEDFYNDTYFVEKNIRTVATYYNINICLRN